MREMGLERCRTRGVSPEDTEDIHTPSSLELGEFLRPSMPSFLDASMGPFLDDCLVPSSFNSCSQPELLPQPQGTDQGCRDPKDSWAPQSWQVPFMEFTTRRNQGEVRRDCLGGTKASLGSHATPLRQGTGGLLHKMSNCRN